MKITFLLTSLITLTILEYSHSQNEHACMEELSRELIDVFETMQACKDEGNPCPVQCALVLEGATNGGILSAESFSAEIRRRVSPNLAAALENLMSGCLVQVDGQLTPDSPCELWTGVGGCFVKQTEHVCEGLSRRGRWGRSRFG
ncbi:unnamed protein product [Allacma fusca]|uniref:Uncharacterized protein n=1 Tax=Allacma fusca TaxID=39272 RepID=A0A8J2P8P9_9HEXA|nr:unnamed protein product [Allacma fusca]